jgi:hypothetical protein
VHTQSDGCRSASTAQDLKRACKNTQDGARLLGSEAQLTDTIERMRLAHLEDVAGERYLRAAGEQETYNAGERLPLSAAERLRIHPSRTIPPKLPPEGFLRGLGGDRPSNAA